MSMRNISPFCNALNSLPEIQAWRGDAHYTLGMKKVEIARAEGVSNSCVCDAIKSGIWNMENIVVPIGFILRVTRLSRGYSSPITQNATSGQNVDKPEDGAFSRRPHNCLKGTA